MVLLKYLFITLVLAAAADISGGILRDSRGKPVRYAGIFSAAPVDLPEYHRKNIQTRAVWCAIVHNLDFPRSISAEQFKKNFAHVLAVLKKHNCNVLIFQVRANGDAAYLSRYNPFSAWLTGREGRTYGTFDPLSYMVRECRRRGIEFHAWLNPYRVTGSTKLSKAGYLRTLSPMHIARRRPDLVLASPTRSGTLALQLDPGRPEVVSHILTTVNEIISRAPVDAIHFDDYFYPYEPLMPGTDNSSFYRYNPRRLPLQEWRRENVNTLIREVSRLCRSRRVRFGVSPFGIWANARKQRGGSLTGGMSAREDIFADTLLWVRNNWIDYIIPQVYWNFDHPKAAYAAVTDWWIMAARKYPGTELYIGHSLGRSAPGELYNQLRYNSVHPEICGEALYALRFLRNKNFSNMLRRTWDAPVPARTAR